MSKKHSKTPTSEPEHSQTSVPPSDIPQGSESLDSYRPPAAPTSPPSSPEKVEPSTLSLPPTETGENPSFSTSADGSPSSTTPTPSRQQPSGVHPPQPERDPVHGTDCLPWYLWAAEYMGDQEFAETYGPRRAAILSRTLPPACEDFLNRLRNL